MKREGKAEVNGRLPEWIPGLRVVLLLAGGVARHHHAPEAEGLDRLEVGDAFGRRTERCLAGTEQACRLRGTVGGDPAVVGVEAGLLVVAVAVVADLHADSWVDDLGAHAIALLVGHSRFRVPAGPVKVAEAHAHYPYLLGRLA